MLLLQADPPKVEESWRTIGGWYKVAGDRTPKPCYHTMETQTKEHEKLYGYMESPGTHIPSNIERPPWTTLRRRRPRSSGQ